MNSVVRFIKKRDNFLWIVCLLSILIKYFYIQSFQGPVISDELIYKTNAQSLLNLSFGNPHFPPLYSLFLSVGFAFGDNFYQGMKLINAILATSTIIPAWLYMKKHVSWNINALVCLLICLMPFGYTYSKLLMSENLFLPLFLISMFSFFNFIEYKTMKWACLSGITLALCLLTRYFSIVLLPIYTIVYFYAKTKEELLSKNNLETTALLIFMFLFVSSLYYIQSYTHFFTLSGKYVKKTAGIHILTNHFVWFIIYASYTTLIISPFLTPIIIKIRDTLNNTKSEKKDRTILLFIFSTTLFSTLLAVKHSGHRDYEKWYMLGRYVMFSALPWIIWSSSHFDAKIIDKKRYLYPLASSVLTVLALLSLNGILIPVSSKLINPFTSPEGYLWVNFSIPLLSVVLISNFFYLNRKKLLFPMLILTHLFFPLLAMGVMDYGMMPNVRALFSDKKATINVYSNDRRIKDYLDFWDIDNYKIYSLNESFKTLKSGILVTKEKDVTKKEFGHYAHGGINYIYQLSESKNIEKAKIFGGGFSKEDQRAIWIKCHNHSKKTIILWNGEKVPTTYYNDHLTAYLPKTSLSKTSLTIFISDPQWSKDLSLVLKKKI